MTEYSNLARVSDVLTISLASLAAGAYSAPSSLVDNTTTGPHGRSYLRGALRLALASAVTATSAGGSVIVYILEARDGTNLPSPPGTSAIAPAPNEWQVIKQVAASAAFQILDFPEIDMSASQYAFQVYNNSSVAFPSTATLTLYRSDVQGA